MRIFLFAMLALCFAAGCTPSPQECAELFDSDPAEALRLWAIGDHEEKQALIAGSTLSTSEEAKEFLDQRIVEALESEKGSAFLRSALIAESGEALAERLEDFKDEERASFMAYQMSGCCKEKLREVTDNALGVVRSAVMVGDSGWASWAYTRWLTLGSHSLTDEQVAQQFGEVGTYLADLMEEDRKGVDELAVTMSVNVVIEDDGSKKIYDWLSEDAWWVDKIKFYPGGPMYRPDEQLAAGLPDGDYTAYRILHHVLPEMYSELQVWLDMSPRRRGYIREGLARMIALVHPTYQRVLPLRTGWPAEVINNIDTRSNTGASWINFMEGQFSLPPAFAPTDTYPQRCRLLGAEDQAFREAIVSVLRPHAARVHQSCTKLVRGVAGLGAWLNFCEASPVESVDCVTAEQHISRWASAVSALDKAVHTVAMGEHRLGKAKANRALYQREFKQVMKDKGVTEGAVRVNSKAGMMEFDVVPVWLDPYRGYVPSGQRGILKSIVPMQRGAYHRVFLKIIDYREVTLNGYPTKVPVYTSDQDAHDAHGKVWNADIDQREQPKLMRQARRQLPAAKRNERVARDELESFLAPFR